MRNIAVIGVTALILLAGCSGVLGGPNVVEKECVEVAGAFADCTAVVENPEEETMTVEVTANVGSASESKTAEIEPGKRKNISVNVNMVGDVKYSIEVEEVDS